MNLLNEIKCLQQIPHVHFPSKPAMPNLQNIPVNYTIINSCSKTFHQSGVHHFLLPSFLSFWKFHPISTDSGTAETTTNIPTGER